MDICDSLIELRIALTTCCDGFSVENSNKDILLSSRIKVLHLLSTKDMMPGELIEYVLSILVVIFSKNIKIFTTIENSFYFINKIIYNEYKLKKCCLDTSIIYEKWRKNEKN